MKCQEIICWLRTESHLAMEAGKKAGEELQKGSSPVEESRLKSTGDGSSAKERPGGGEGVQPI